MKPLLLACLFLPFFAFAQKKIIVTSPDKNLVFSFTLAGSKPAYSVAYKKQLLINNSAINLVFADGSFTKNITVSKPVYKDTTEEYDLITGKTSHVTAHYKEAIIPLFDASKNALTSG